MTTKKQRKELEKIKQKEMAPSCQMNIPIKDVYRGVVITGKDAATTKDSQYIKVMEVKPQPFDLKKVFEQNMISDSFATLLKEAPDDLHIKSMSVPADMSYQLSEIENCMAEEDNGRCLQMGQEYIQRLRDVQDYGFQRRFFVSFPYKERKSAFGSVGLDDIVNSLNLEAARLAANLAACGNEVVQEYPDDPNMEVLKTFYMVYNRNRYAAEPFEDRINEVNRRYLAEMGNKYFYIPVVDYIAPGKMSYMSGHYLVINDMYYRFLYIPSYGYRPVDTAGWLGWLIAKPGVDVDIFLKRMPKDQVMHQIRRSIGHSRATATESSDNTESFEESLHTLQSAQYLKNGLAMGNDFYNMAIFLTVSSTSPKDLAVTIDELKLEARGKDTILKENLFRSEETFNIVLPTGIWDDRLYTFKKSQRNVLTEGAAGLYPFTVEQISDKDGLLIAEGSNGSPVVLDQFNRQRVHNPHIFISGETGAGKTTTLMEIALRARVKQMPVYLIVPEKQDEYKRLTAAIGGQFIDIGAGSKDRINIMEIFPVDEKSRDKMAMIDGDEGGGSESFLIRKTKTLSDFFALHIPTLSSVEKFDLEEAIIATYEKKGITSSNESLWADEKHTHYKSMPIVSDLVAELEAKPDTLRLSKTIRLLTRGNGEHFNGQTNVDINNKFVVFGLQHNSEDMLGLSIFMTMDFITSKCMEDRTKKKFFIIDEAWRLMMNPVAANRLMASSKLLRAFSTCMCIGTQQMGDVLAYEGGKYGLAVLNNCATKILMNMKAQDAEIVQDILDLSDNERIQVTRLRSGEGLLLAGDNRMFIRMTLTETEKLLTFTDTETLNRFINLKLEEERQALMDEQMKDATDIGELFDLNETAEAENDTGL